MRCDAFIVIDRHLNPPKLRPYVFIATQTQATQVWGNVWQEATCGRSQDDVLIAIDTETHLNPAQQANYVLIAFEIQ